MQAQLLNNKYRVVVTPMVSLSLETKYLSNRRDKTVHGHAFKQSQSTPL